MLDPCSDLREIASLADQVGAPGVRTDADVLGQRLAEGRFYVVCLGQFKRGKSTLLNTVVGAPELPVGVAPVTSVVTVLRYGERRAARLRTSAAGWREIDPETLADYVSEERNPGNAKGVLGIEVFVPAPLLQKGLCLVDTPGIGSIFAENTAATREFLPQLDAAIIVLGADPPITGDELALVQDVAARVPYRLFVLAKADRMSDTERREALVFTRRVLADRLKTDPGVIFEVSASEVLSGGCPTRDWPALIQALDDLATRAGADLVAGAQQRGTANLVERLVTTIDDQLRTLERPLAESEARLAALRRGIAGAERALSDLGPLFAAEEARLLAILEADRDAFFLEAGPATERELDVVFHSLHERGPALRERAVAEAAAIARRSLDDWHMRKAAHMDGLFRRAMRRFVELLAVVEQALVESTGEQGPRTLAVETALRSPSHFYMTEMLAVAPVSLGKRLLDVVGVASERRSAAIRRDARAYLVRLMDANSSRIKNDFRERLAASRRSLETDVRRRLGDLATTAEQALERARVLQESGVWRVQAERERLRTALEESRRIRARTATEKRGTSVGAL